MSDIKLLSQALHYLEANPPAIPPEAFGDSAALNPAVAHCCAAYENARKATLATGKSSLSAQWAGQSAYSNAMPTLSTRQNAIDFIACVTHGILIEAIKEQKVTKLLYAAQVASAAIPRSMETKRLPAKKE